MGAPAARKELSDEPAEEEKLGLLRIAREAIAARLEGKKYEPVPIPSLDERKQGVFVTLWIYGKLRGCMGRIQARESVPDAVAMMAPVAAFEDPRFPELTPEELPDLMIELSLLSRLERVRDFDNDIVVGRDGLLVKLDLHSGLLLPRIPVEYGWGTREFLEQTCLKAGLPKNAYKDKYAEVYKFTAFKFCEQAEK